MPLRWWAALLAVGATVLLATAVAIPLWAAVLVTAVLVGGLGAMLASYGSARLRLRDGVLVAGRAHIPVSLLALPESLDAERTRSVAGPDADARAYLLLRPYLPRAVRVEVRDPHDPAPYWLLSTRRPDELAGALRRVLED